MKKFILLIALIFIIVSCSDIQEFENEINQRGRKCVYNQYGNIVCGFKSPPINR